MVGIVLLIAVPPCETNYLLGIKLTDCKTTAICLRLKIQKLDRVIISYPNLFTLIISSTKSFAVVSITSCKSYPAITSSGQKENINTTFAREQAVISPQTFSVKKTTTDDDKELNNGKKRILNLEK